MNKKIIISEKNDIKYIKKVITCVTVQITVQMLLRTK